MENRNFLNFSAYMDNAKKSVITIFEDRLEKMTASLDTLNNTNDHVLTLNETKTSNSSAHIYNKNKINEPPRVNRLMKKFKSQKNPFKHRRFIRDSCANKALGFKMVLARRKFYKYESLKQRINKTLYYFKGFKRFKCQKCAKIFKFESNFKKHSCVHSIKTKSSSSFEINSRNHLRKKHSKSILWRISRFPRRSYPDSRPNSCDECGKKFPTPSHLIIHKRSHTKEKPYACDFCEKKFSTLHGLKVHKRLHTGERPYSCDFCQKKFSALSNFNSHKRVHTGERPYSCDKCGKRFSHLTNLKCHSKIH
jgi:DNA-directed RNA polymerase subunit RPC12/RpoP